jgi:DNA polymerase II small subunit/DNA polymerase delta subunit B
MFPELTTRETLNLVTNPHHFQMNGLDFLGTSGQSVHDMQLFAKFAKASGLDCLRM